MNNTTSTPKCLSDLRYQDNVLTLKTGKMVDAEANRWFHELFDNQDHVTVRHLFTEDDQKVYEAYQDSGSVDYLYIVA